MSTTKEQQRNYLGMPNDLLGYQLLPFNPYPETQLQYQNLTLETDRRRKREEAESDAMLEANMMAEQAIESEEFSRRLTIGSVVKPRNETLAGYQAMLKLSGKKPWDVRFSPKGYGAFDDIIVKKAGLDPVGNSTSPAFNPEHPRYQDFAPLRRNVAILRNYLMTQMFADGEFIPDNNSAAGAEDLARYRMLNQMAERLGEAMASDSGKAPGLVSRWSSSAKSLLKGQSLDTPDITDFLSAANVPDKGALVMYNYLYGLHETPEVKDLYSNQTPKHWPLKPREQTVFSDENLRLYSRSSRMQGTVDAYDNMVMSQLRAPEKLSPEDRNESVQLAHEILERLKKLLASSADQEQRSQLTDSKLDESSQLLKVADTFRETMARIADVDPTAIQNNRTLSQATSAFEQLGYRMKVETHKALTQEREPTAAKEMEKSIAQTPESYKTKSSTESLLSQVENGLKEADRIARQARIAQRIAQREAQRQASRNNRASGQSAALANAAIARAGRSSRAAVDTQAAMNKAAASATAMGDLKLNFDSMAGARVSEVNEPAAQYTRKVMDEHVKAPVLNQDSNRSR